MSEERKPIMAYSVDARLLYEALLKAGIGETATYAQLSALIGRDVRDGAHSCLATARRRARRQDRVLFEAVKNDGLKRLGDLDIPHLGEKYRRRYRNLAKRAAEDMACVHDFPSLPAKLQVEHNTTAALAGAIYEMSKPSSVKRLSEHVAQAGNVLPVAGTLRAFIE